MEEIRRVAVACGLRNFRYYSFPAVAFAPPQTANPRATAPVVAENASVESVGASAHRRPKVIDAPVEVLSSPLLASPVAVAYLLLAEVAEAVADPRAAAAPFNSPTTAGNIAQALSRPTRRRPRPAGRAALAAIRQT